MGNKNSTSRELDPSARWNYDDFEFKKELKGKGANGKVYEAWHKLEKKRYAIKQLKGDNAEHEKEAAELVQELQSSYIVKFHGCFTDRDVEYIVMDFCPDRTLEELIKEEKEKKKKGEPIWDDETIKTWANQLMHALIEMKQKKIIHNDIKPANIMVNAKDNSLLVVDLGEVQVVNKIDTMSTRAKTVAYAAPERLIGNPRCSFDSDTWSCAVVIYEIIHLRSFPGFAGQISYDSTPIAQFFKPILEKIFVNEPTRRPTAEIVSMMITMPERIPQTVDTDYFSFPQRIQSRLPDIEITEKFIPIIEMDTIDTAFKQDNVVVLHGIGGAGKTTLAAEYARWHHKRHKGSVVVWIDADSRSKIDQSIRKLLVQDLKFPERDFQNMTVDEKLAEIVKHVTRIRRLHLLVFDNIEKEDTARAIEAMLESLPPESFLRIVLTSRDFQLSDEKFAKQMFEMGNLSEDHVRLYFFGRAKAVELSLNKAELIFDKVLLNRQGGITPYYLSKVTGTMEIYIEDNGGLRNEDLKELMRRLRGVDITDEMLDILESRAECQEILRVLPFLDQDQISWRLLHELCVDKEHKRLALETLQKYSLITVFSLDELKCIRLHRLSSEAMKKRLLKDKDIYTRAKKKMMRKLRELTENAMLREENWDVRDEKVTDLQNHLAQMCQLISADDLEEINFIDSLILVKSLTQDREQVQLQEEKIRKLKDYYPEEESWDIANNLAELCAICTRLGVSCNAAHGQRYVGYALDAEALRMVQQAYADNQRSEKYAINLFKICKLKRESYFHKDKEILDLVVKAEDIYLRKDLESRICPDFLSILKLKRDVLKFTEKADQLNKEIISICRLMLQNDYECAIFLLDCEAYLTSVEGPDFGLFKEALGRLVKSVKSGRKIESSLDELVSRLESCKNRDDQTEESERTVIELSQSVARLAKDVHFEEKTGQIYHARRMKRLALFRTKNSQSFNPTFNRSESLKEAAHLLKSQFDTPRGFDIDGCIRIAESHYDMGDREEAFKLLKWSESSLKNFCEKFAKEHELATHLIELVKRYQDWGEQAEASRLLQEAAEFCKTHEMSRPAVWKADTLRFIGHGLMRLKKSDDAFEFCRKWELDSGWKRENGDLSKLINTGLRDIAEVYIQVDEAKEAMRLLGEYVRVVNEIIEALDPYDFVSDDDGLLSKEPLVNSAKLLIQNRKIDEACRLLKDAQRLNKKWCLKNSLSPFKSNFVNMSQLIDLYQQCGDQEEEVDRLSQDMQFYEKIEKKAKKLKFKADEFKRNGQYDEAMEYYKKCQSYIKVNKIYWLKKAYAREIKQSYRDMDSPKGADWLQDEIELESYGRSEDEEWP